VHEYLSQILGFAEPDAVAVDSSSDLFVADRRQKFVYRFGAGGAPSAFSAAEPYVEGARLIGTPTGAGGSVVAFGEPAGVAAQASGRLYVADAERRVVDVFEASGEYVSQLAGTPTGMGGAVVPFVNPEGLAVDRATGNLYVTDRGAGVVDVFSAAGNFITMIEEGRLSGEKLSVDESVAVDELSEELFVGESGPDLVARFDSLGARIGVWTGASIPGIGSFGNKDVHVGIDNMSGHIYVADNHDHVVDELAPSGSGEEEYIGQVLGTPTGPGGALVPFADPLAVAVDPLNEDVYVADERNHGVVDVFGPDIVAPNVTTGAASEVEASRAVLNGRVSTVGEGPASCRFVWGTSEAFGHSVPCVQGSVDGEDQPVSARLEGLEPDMLYFYRLQATNRNGTNGGEESPVEDFMTSGPGLASESASDIAATSATVNATLNPDGAATSYYFQYGPTTGYGSVAPLEPEGIGSEGAPVDVSQHINGLSAGSVYHYRVVAVSEVSFEGQMRAVSFFGADQSFVTQATGGFGLPDGREWELVSQPSLDGALIESAGAEPGITQAAASGDAFAYLTNIPTEGVTGYANKQQVFSVRGASGWVSRDLAQPHEGAVGSSVSSGQEYRFFDENLSVGIIQPFGPFIPDGSPHALAPSEASEQTAFLHDDYLNGNVDDSCMVGCYEPLVSGCPAAPVTCAPGVAEHADVPEGTEFGKFGFDAGPQPCPPAKLCGPQFLGATPDASHVVIMNGTTAVALTATALPEGAAERETTLYEWSAGKVPRERLALVSVLPEGQSSGGYLGTSASKDARHAISDDGSRVSWTAINKHLYMRDLTHGQTVVDGEALPGETAQLDVVQSGATGAGQPEPEFQDASSDGSRVWFTDKQQLTKDASISGEDLYECIITEDPDGKPECDLHDVTPETAAEESADVLGVLGASEANCNVGSDGECDLYFVANGKLTANAVSGTCVRGVADGLCNLYVDRDGVISLVAVLASEDESDWGSKSPELPYMSARVSANGRWVAFLSDRGLTGYDPDDAVSGHPDEEAYLYDASTGSLVCASCNPSGARPAGVEWDGAARVPIFSGTGEGGFAFPTSDWISGLLPSWEAYELDRSRYQTRYLSDEGRLFFDSDEALVPKDINGTWDVYEYEPERVGPVGAACGPETSSGAVVFKPAHTYAVEGREGEEGAGCVGLISSGTSPQESAFMDASETGGDVFFMTTAQLVPQAIEDTYGVYDAHECTVQSPCIPQLAAAVPECVTAESCRAALAPEPSIYGAPPSVMFSGAGNVPPAPAAVPKSAVKAKPPTRAQKLAAALKTCRKKRARKKRQACEKQARRTYGSARPAAPRHGSSKKRG
jgi:DNA-binding beta-propeller fold protein YncE